MLTIVTAATNPPHDDMLAWARHVADLAPPLSHETADNLAALLGQRQILEPIMKAA